MCCGVRKGGEICVGKCVGVWGKIREGVGGCVLGPHIPSPQHTSLYLPPHPHISSHILYLPHTQDTLPRSPHTLFHIPPHTSPHPLHQFVTSPTPQHYSPHPPHSPHTLYHRPTPSDGHDKPFCTKAMPIIDKSEFLKAISIINECCDKFLMCLTKFFLKSNCKNVFSRFFKKIKQLTDSAVKLSHTKK